MISLNLVGVGKMGRFFLWLLFIVLVILTVAYFTVNIIVIQPIGALPEGRTVIVTRLTNVQFIDSADAICQRTMGGVSLLCRGVVLGRIAEEGNILLRLPYSKQLYLWSTGGIIYGQ